MNVCSCTLVCMVICATWPARARATESRVNTDPGAAYQGYSTCATAPDGRFVVAWEDARNGGIDIYLQRFAATGERLGGNVRVNDSLAPEQFAPSVAADAFGNAWIVWQDFRASGYPQNGDIYLRRIDHDGVFLGPAVPVNSDASFTTQKEPGIAIGSHEAIVVWADMRRGEWDIYIQRYDLNGTPLGPNLRINDEGGTAPQHAPSIAAMVDGSFAVTWYDTRLGNEDVFFQMIAAAGGVLRGPNTLASIDAGGSRQRFPAVGAGPSDGFMIVWEDYRDGVYPAGVRIYGQLVAASGILLDTNFAVSPSDIDQRRPRLASDHLGNRVLVWEELAATRATIMHRKYVSGDDTGSTVALIGPDTAHGDRTRPQLALGAGKVFYTWSDSRDGDFDVYLFVESFRFPTFRPTPGGMLFELPARAKDTVLTEFVRVTALGQTSLRIGWAGLPDWLTVFPGDERTPADFQFTLAGYPGQADTALAIWAVDLDDSLAQEAVNVTVDVLFPELLAVPAAVSFDFDTPEPDSARVVISNRKPGLLEWQFEALPAPWSVTRSGDSLMVRFDPGSLYNTVVADTLWIIDSLAVNSPLPVPVTAAVLTVPPVVPTLVATPAELYWTVPYKAATGDSVTLRLSALPEQNLLWMLSGKDSWLYVDGYRGTTPADLVFRAAFDSLPPGTYIDTIKVLADASNSPLRIPIEMRVVPPSIVAIPAALEWHAQAGAATRDSVLMSLLAIPDAPLGWLITGRPTWLSINRPQGFTPSVVTFRAASDDLPYGVYTDTLRVLSEAANSPLAVPVRLIVDVVSEIGSEPSAEVTASALEIYPNPFNASVLVSWQQPAGEPYQIEVFNLLGRRVVLATGLGTGLQGNLFSWRPESGVASGVYLVRLATAAGIEVRKAAYLK